MRRVRDCAFSHCVLVGNAIILMIVYMLCLRLDFDVPIPASWVPKAARGCVPQLRRYV
jgi:hypothetical protein